MQEMELTLKEVITETPDTKTLAFEKPKDLEYEAGQFFIIEVPVENEERPQNRSYSTSSSPLDGTLDFTIKEIPSGRCSRILCNSEPGDKYKVKGPFGRFMLNKDEKRNVVFICGGSGVTPFRGMLRYAFAKGMKTKFDLFYSVRIPEQVIFSKELEKMGREHYNLKTYITCTRLEKGQRWVGMKGRFNINLIKEKVGKLKGKVFYLCGGPEIVQTFEEALKTEGIPIEDIKKERFY